MDGDILDQPDRNRAARLSGRGCYRMAGHSGSYAPVRLDVGGGRRGRLHCFADLHVNTELEKWGAKAPKSWVGSRILWVVGPGSERCRGMVGKSDRRNSTGFHSAYWAPLGGCILAGTGNCGWNCQRIPAQRKEGSVQGIAVRAAFPSRRCSGRRASAARAGRGSRNDGTGRWRGSGRRWSPDTVAARPPPAPPPRRPPAAASRG